jgi:ketosteroid isomerase-like protein
VKTNRINTGKRNFFLKGIIALASLKLLNFRGPDQASAGQNKSSNEPSADEISGLKEMIASQNHEMKRLKAINDVQNLMGRYEVVHITPNEIGQTSELFALWREDCSVEVSDGGVIFGPKNIREYWRAMVAYSIKATAFFHTLASPVIQVAGNGMTAKATWASPGFECGLELKQGEPPFAKWCWGRYAMDFIKNPKTGEWKIWHMHWFRMMRNDYHKDFVEFAQYEHDNPPQSRPKEGNYEAMPTVFHRPLSVTEDTHPFPIDPEPYTDYDGDFRWPYGGREFEEKYGVTYPAYEKFYNVNYPGRV